MMIMAHGTVGLQHASMAIYNAYADRVPVYIILGNVATGHGAEAMWNGHTRSRTPR
jgi:thiamine pyrophosphate-dependent acetolactate synthase large subunit-like protein